MLRKDDISVTGREAQVKPGSGAEWQSAESGGGGATWDFCHRVSYPRRSPVIRLFRQSPRLNLRHPTRWSDGREWSTERSLALESWKCV